MIRKNGKLRNEWVVCASGDCYGYKKCGKMNFYGVLVGVLYSRATIVEAGQCRPGRPLSCRSLWHTRRWCYCSLSYQHPFKEVTAFIHATNITMKIIITKGTAFIMAHTTHLTQKVDNKNSNSIFIQFTAVSSSVLFEEHE